MIRFRCEQCGWAVRVPSAYAGKMGRCPSCKAVVRIPGTLDDAAPDAVSQLAQAAREPSPAAQGEQPCVPPTSRPPPPPLPEYHIDQDDVEIPEDPSGETDVMPPEEVIDASEAKRRRRAAREANRLTAQARAQAAVAPIRRRNNLLRIIILVGIGVAVLAIAVTAMFLLSGKS